jgi:hypothetical protein
MRRQSPIRKASQKVSDLATALVMFSELGMLKSREGYCEETDLPMLSVLFFFEFLVLFAVTLGISLRARLFCDTVRRQECLTAENAKNA